APTKLPDLRSSLPHCPAHSAGALLLTNRLRVRFLFGESIRFHLQFCAFGLRHALEVPPESGISAAQRCLRDANLGETSRELWNAACCSHFLWSGMLVWLSARLSRTTIL